MPGRSRNLILNLLLFVVSFEVAGCSKQTPASSKTAGLVSDRDTPSESMPPHDVSSADSNNVDTRVMSDPESGAVAESATATSTDSEGLTDEDLTRTSWENPFQSRLWASEDWKLDATSMTFESAESRSVPPLAATFLRPYRNIVIECRLACPAITTSRASPESTQTHPSHLFELRLVGPDTGGWAGLIIDADSVSLIEATGSQQPVQRILRKCPRDVDEIRDSNSRQADVRITMTANRILVAVDGRLKINVTRPGAILNADCQAQFIAHQPGTTLSELRIEGE